jgi:outer membrane protein TolC
MESRMELVELRQQQLDARVSAFQALGGGIEVAGGSGGAPPGPASGGAAP